MDPLFPAPDANIAKQVLWRQLYLSQNPEFNSSPYVQNWKFNNTAWVRLASSVNLVANDNGTKRILKAIGLSENDTNYLGSKLAESCVLYNGVSKINETQNESGDTSIETLIRSLDPNSNYVQNISYKDNPDYSPINDFTYGFGGNVQGLRPQPGIVSVNVGYINRGTNAKIEIEIIAFNREQLAIIDALYCHPGYNLLLEWGHTSYINNDGSFVTAQPSNSTPALNKLFKGGQFDVSQMYNIIKGTASGRGGNYEGFFGPISNFSYKFNPDGTYTINVTLISLGAIAESLKTNIPSANSEFVTTTKDIASDLKKALEAEKAKFEKLKAQVKEAKNNAAAEQANQEYQSRNQDNTRIAVPIVRSIEYTDKLTGEKKTLNAGIDPLSTAQAEVEKAQKAYDEALKNSEEDPISANANIKFSNLLAYFLDQLRQSTDQKFPGKEPGIKVGTVNNYNVCKLVFKEYSKNKKYAVGKDGEVTETSLEGSETYIRLGDLLDFINENLIVTDGTNRLLSIDNNSYSNDCSRVAYSVSNDPTICIIDNPDLTKGGICTELSAINKGFKINSTKGRTMNIWVNVNFAALTSAQYSDSKGNLSLYSFLSHLMNGLKDALGGINDWEVSYNHESNKITIKELIYSFTNNDKKGIIPKFNIFGFQPTQFNDGDGNSVTRNLGSFVESVDFTTQIDKDLGSMAVIAAKSGGADPLATESTPFSQYNSGLDDRTFTEKKFNISPQTTEDKKPSNFVKKEIEELYRQASKIYKDYILEYDHINDFITACKTYSNYRKNYDSSPQIGVRPASFLLPFNLSLSIMGMGGWKLYDRFTTDKKILPPTFDDLDFIIKSISHSITGNKWVTKIESMAGASKHLKEVEVEETEILKVEQNLTPSSSGNCSITPYSNLSTSAQSNIKYLYNILIQDGFSDLEARAIIAVSSKESGLIPKNEISYVTTNLSRIKEIFGDRAKHITEKELKAKQKLGNPSFDNWFWDLMYGIDAKKNSPSTYKNLGFYTENPPTDVKKGDGAKYLGRGFNGITGKAQYYKLQKQYESKGSPHGKINIFEDPDSLNKKDNNGIYKVSAAFSSQYFQNGKKSKPNPYGNDIEGLITYFIRLNAGWGNGINGAITQEGLCKAKKFVKTLPETM